jgi:chemotaxis protein CheD
VQLATHLARTGGVSQGSVMSEHGQSLRVQVLHPGDVAFGERGDRLETLLGSCVAIILTDPRRTQAVMCHFVHSRPSPANDPHNAHFAEVALGVMYATLVKRGIAPKRCEAYVYGGGNMFPDMSSSTHVGQRNAQWALDALLRDKVRVVHQDLGGPTYRRVAWTVGTEQPQVTRVPI